MTQEKSTQILIVDDEPYIRDILSRWLTGEGYHCISAANVDTALEFLAENNIGLILLDMMIPEKSGLVLLHKVQKNHPDVIVLMVSALDRPKLITGTLELGAYGYITKPFDRDEIVDHVVSALQHREEMLQARDSR